MELNQGEYLQYLQLACGNKAPRHAIVFKWFTELHRGKNSLFDEEHTEQLLSVVVPENVSRHMKNVINDNHWIYQIMQGKLNIAYTAMHKIIHKELLIKKN